MMRSDNNWLQNLPGNRLVAEMSLWSADLMRLADEMDRIERFTDIYHVDVADGVFSPALLFFPDLVAAIRKKTAKPIHVHLMVEDAILETQIDQFAEAGADLISVHAENSNAGAALAKITGHGLLAGLVLQVHTPVSAANRFLGRISFLTLLGTAIGVKGQGLDSAANDRLSQARALIASHNTHRIVLAADGGIREHTVPGLCNAGAQTIVMGSLAMNAPDLSARMAWVHGLGARATSAGLKPPRTPTRTPK